MDKVITKARAKKARVTTEEKRMAVITVRLASKVILIQRTRRNQVQMISQSHLKERNRAATRKKRRQTQSQAPRPTQSQAPRPNQSQAPRPILSKTKTLIPNQTSQLSQPLSQLILSLSKQELLQLPVRTSSSLESQQS